MWPFKKAEGKGFDFDTIISAARAFGFDIYDMAEKKMPEALAMALQLEHVAGARLVGMLSISNDSTHFILSLYKMQEGGHLELWKAYPLNDVKSIIEQIKNAVNSKPDADASFEPIAALPGAAPTINASSTDGNHDEWAWADNARAAQQPGSRTGAGQDNR
jgi:hypothetical protein